MALNEYHYSVDKGTARSIYNTSLVRHESIEKADTYTKAKNKEGVQTTWFSVKEADYSWWSSWECPNCSGFGCLACNGRGCKEVGKGVS